MPIAKLADRALLDISGPDAEHFLQNLITTDLDQLEERQLAPSALLTPQGKILFDFLVGRTEDGFLIECRADIVDDLARRLMLYKLRAKVAISKRDEALVLVSWDDDSVQTSGSAYADKLSKSTYADKRFRAAAVSRSYDNAVGPTASETDWTAFRLAAGVAESGADYALGDAFPHDVLLDQNGGVGFRKGCYVGQEVVSRMHHRGTARRRILLVQADAALPPPGTDIKAGGKSIGTMGGSAIVHGLAVVRIDKVRDALDGGLRIEADGVALRCTIPEWASFTFPMEPPPSDEDSVKSA